MSPMALNAVTYARLSANVHSFICIIKNSGKNVCYQNELYLENKKDYNLNVKIEKAKKTHFTLITEKIEKKDA
jgi:hypothetical protein